MASKVICPGTPGDAPLGCGRILHQKPSRGNNAGGGELKLWWHPNADKQWRQSGFRRTTWLRDLLWEVVG
jgi:hypothetical protein